MYLKCAHRLANVVIYGGTNGVRLAVIDIKTHHVLFTQEWLNFAASGKVGGEVCIVIFLDRVWVLRSVSVALGEFKF